MIRSSLSLEEAYIEYASFKLQANLRMSYSRESGIDSSFDSREDEEERSRLQLNDIRFGMIDSHKSCI